MEALIKSFRASREDFDLNRRIEVNYYGEGMLRAVLKKYLLDYCQSGALRELLALRMLTYFTAVAIHGEEAVCDETLLRDVERVAEDAGHDAMLRICSGIRSIWNQQER